MNKILYIWCSKCNRKVKVTGYIWKDRLQYSSKDPAHKGCYQGWYGDNCADAIEAGIDYE